MRARLSALTGVLALILACLLAPAATAADRYDGIAVTIMDKLGSIHQGIMISDETGTLTKSDCQASGDYQANFSSKSSGSTCLIYKSYSTSAPPIGVYITNKTSSSYDFTFKGYSNILNSIVKGKSGLDITLAGTMLGVPKGSSVTADGAEKMNASSSDIYGWDTDTSTPEASGSVNFNGSSGGGSNGGGGSSSNGDLGIGDLNGNSGGSGGSNNSTASPAPSDSPTSDQKGATPAPSATSTAQTSSSSSSSSDDDNTTLYIVAAVVAVIAVIGVIATVLVVKKNGKKNDQANFGPYPGAPGTGFGPNGPGFGGPAGPGYGPNNFGGPSGPGAPAGGMAPGAPNYGGPNGPVGGPNGPVNGPSYGAPNGPAGGPNYGGPNGPAGGPNYGGPNAPAGSSAPVAPSAPAAPSYPQGGYQGGPGAAQGGPTQNGAAQGGYQSPNPSAPSAGYAAAPSAQSAAAGSPFAGQPAATNPAQPASPAQPLPSSSAGDDVVLPPQVTPAQPQDYDAAPAAGGDAEDYYPTIRLGQDEGLAPTRQYPRFNQNN